MGFNLQEVTETEPKAKFLAKSYLAAIRGVVKNNPNTQFVFIDHPDELDKSFENIENISCDSYENVLQLLT
jgi:basic membrane lipoprotein Med (substrate-binding protein (PBP1-ABC) superfamily)